VRIVDLATSAEESTATHPVHAVEQHWGEPGGDRGRLGQEVRKLWLDA